MRLRDAWRKLNEPRESRGYVMRWGCPGDECPGTFRTRERAEDHGRIARVIGSHEARPQRRARRARSQAARHLRRQR